MNTSLVLRGLSSLLIGSALVGCGGNRNGAANASGGGAASSETGGAGGASAGPSACDDFGHFGTPSLTFTLPAGKAMISYPDVQKSFPDVDWANLDRLYVPAGKYKSFELGNLPRREASRKLVITNIGGQVQVGPNLGGNFIWSMGGGSNWVLTGRYDPDSRTGDAGFPG